MIYCVEDEKNIRELIIYTLETSGYRAKGFVDGNSMLKEVKQDMPRLILLDIMLPGEDGMSILRKLKSSADTKDISVIMVTAKGTEYDKVMGLEGGADDYITKPFGMMEFIARVKAVLRRGKVKEDINLLQEGELTLVVDQHRVMVQGKEVALTLKEFELLKLLIENKGIVLSRDKLLERIWGYDFDGETRTVDVHVRTLRQKLLECGSMIETVRGVGYRIGGNR